MSSAFVASYVALWALVVAIAVALVWLRRRLPGLHQPVLHDIPAGYTLPPVRLNQWEGGSLSIPSVGVPHMVLFGRPGCDFCRLALEATVTLANEAIPDIRWVFVYSGTKDEANVITARLALGSVWFALGGEVLRQQLNITTMPFVVAIDNNGTITAKEAVRNRRHLESLANSLRSVPVIA